MFTLLGGIKVILLGLNRVRVTLEKGMPPVATHLYQIWYKVYTSVFAVCNRIMALFVLNMNKKCATTEKMVNRFIIVVTQPATGETGK